VCIDPAGLTVTAAASVLGVSHKALSELLNGHAGISPELEVCLSKAFGGSTESWLCQQMLYDLAQLEKKAERIKVKRFGASPNGHDIAKWRPLSAPTTPENGQCYNARHDAKGRVVGARMLKF